MFEAHHQNPFIARPALRCKSAPPKAYAGFPLQSGLLAHRLNHYHHRKTFKASKIALGYCRAKACLGSTQIKAHRLNRSTAKEIGC